ncbi:hypothetical protein BS47DRAFT_1341639 [Hydnum rufescens UP504]|uniref:Uncharacterized protein n=1 Tax=Hydnum rufescens UP504 TaxID=1448309 RepID=A0A9P6B128_9AGAM|nr:hypothetical protein BS47DRAFT_1341639 [Hydnum rufescens UP504]
MAQQFSISDKVLYIIAIFVPPFTVYAKVGLTAEIALNVILWFLGWIPGVLHAWWVISRHPQE